MDDMTTVWTGIVFYQTCGFVLGFWMFTTGYALGRYTRWAEAVATGNI